MKILLVTQHFWPENFRINDVCLGLQSRGHEVVVLTGKPNYPKGDYYEGYSWWKKRKEEWNGITIYRSNLLLRKKGTGFRLILNYFSFAFLASVKVLAIKGPFDKVFVFAPSPITVGIPGIVARYRFGVKNYLWIQDLWPESIRIAGGINNKQILGLTSWMTKMIYKGTHKLLVQSRGFIPYILNQDVKEEKLIYYPFYAEDFYKVEPKEQAYKEQFPEGFNLVFAGNIGEAQSFNTLLEAADMLQKRNIPVNWIVFGDGRRKEYVQSQIKELGLTDNFKLMGSFPATEMPKYFSCADGLIVSLKDSFIFERTIPSKVQSYLACGRPIIGSLNGVGADIIQSANAGFVGAAEDSKALTEAVVSLYHLSEEERGLLGKNARAYYEKEFDRELLLDQLEHILNN
ncbi:MAG: glycosyltransferase family 4 protein [Bacteroidota bacterium]